MAAPWDEYWEYDEDEEISQIGTDAVKCNRCGEKGFHWGKGPTGWRLFKDGKLHVCNPK